MAGQGMDMASMFIELGDKLHKNFNQTMSIAQQNNRAIEKNKILMEQLEQQKKEFGLNYALERLMTMEQISSMEKQAMMLELTGRADAQNKFMDTQKKEMDMRSDLEDKGRRESIGKGFAKGFSKSIQGSGKFGGQQAPASGPLLNNQPNQPVQPVQSTQQSQPLLNSVA